MTDKPKKKHKSRLTPEEVITAMYRCLVLHELQHVVAAKMGILNQGRVNEAVTVGRWVWKNHMAIHKQLMAVKKAKKANGIVSDKPEQLTFDVDMPVKPV